MNELKKEKILTENFNKFWNEFFKTEKDYYSLLSFDDLIKLKTAVSNINNLITYNTAIFLTEKISEILNFNEKQKNKIIEIINSSNSNTNGYDICFEEKISFLAEVKCNIPINNGEKFGANQEKEIRKDIISLLEGKKKANLKNNLKEYYKFLGIYCCNQNTVKAVQNLLNKKFFKNLNVEIHKKETILEKDKVYIILIDEKI